MARGFEEPNYTFHILMNSVTYNSTKWPLLLSTETCERHFLPYSDDYKNKILPKMLQHNNEKYKCSDIRNSEFLINEMMLIE